MSKAIMCLIMPCTKVFATILFICMWVSTSFSSEWTPFPNGNDEEQFDKASLRRDKSGNIEYWTKTTDTYSLDAIVGDARVEGIDVDVSNYAYRLEKKFVNCNKYTMGIFGEKLFDKNDKLIFSTIQKKPYLLKLHPNTHGGGELTEICYHANKKKNKKGLKNN